MKHEYNPHIFIMRLIWCYNFNILKFKFLSFKFPACLLSSVWFILLMWLN